MRGRTTYKTTDVEFELKRKRKRIKGGGNNQIQAQRLQAIAESSKKLLSHSTYASYVNYDAEHESPGQCDDHLKNTPVRRAMATYRNSFRTNVSFTGYGYVIYFTRGTI